MKYVVLICCLFLSLSITRATTYYSQGSLTANNLASWNSIRIGGGGAPGAFTNAGDIFVIQAGHTLTTSATWVLGGSGSILQIETGGTLQANHLIQFTGTFQIDNGGTYIHNNNGAVTTTAATSIFGGTEAFATASTVEIRNWINNTTPVPASINWGNLTINYTVSIGGNWNQGGNLTSTQGDLIVRSTGTAGQQFILTNATNMTCTVNGDLQMTGGTLTMKDDDAIGTTGILQVNGNVVISGGTLNVGTAALYANGEFRFKGNLTVSGSGAVTSADDFVTAVANGTDEQLFSSSSVFGCNLKINTASTLTLNSALSFSAVKLFIISGTCNAGGNAIDMNGGELIVSGGTFDGSGNINMEDGKCRVCTGAGNFNVGNFCANSGNTGIFNYREGTMLFNRSLASNFLVGSVGSKGEVYLTDGSQVAFTGTLSGPFPNSGLVELTGNGILSFDETSNINGNAVYNGNGGWLTIGSASGISTSGNFGNIRVSGTRNYQNGGINSFEFKSTLPQSTGNGLPATINGTLKINNSSSQDMILDAATTIAAGGTLHLAEGVLKTTTFFLLTMNRNANLLGGSDLSYVSGPLKKIGETPFTFHVGKNGLYSPVALALSGGITDVFTVEYFPGDPAAAYGTDIIPFIDHISSVEYWFIDGPQGVSKSLTLRFTPYSQVSSLFGLRVSFFDGQTWLNSGNEATTGTSDNGTVRITTPNWGPYTLASTEPRHIICPNGNTTFTMPSQGTSFTYRWQLDDGTGAGWVNLNNGGNYSGVTSTSLNLINMPSTFYGYKFRCVATNGVDQVIGEERTLKFSVTWIGAIDAAWENPGNWSCGEVPSENTDVIIPSGASILPEVSSNASCRSLTIFAGSSVNVNTGFKLDIKGPPTNE